MFQNFLQVSTVLPYVREEDVKAIIISVFETFEQRVMKDAPKFRKGLIQVRDGVIVAAIDVETFWY